MFQGEVLVPLETSTSGLAMKSLPYPALLYHRKNNNNDSKHSNATVPSFSEFRILISD
jgi:hypothetical protein